MATIKICSLCQGSHSTSIYIADFRQLVCHIDCDNNAFISAFRWGLQDDVKDLLLNLPNPLTLTEAITQVVRCDNRLFKHRQEQWSIKELYKAEIITLWKQTSINASMPKPMQIDSSRFKKLSQKKKTDDTKKVCVCIVVCVCIMAEKITKLEIFLLKLQPQNYIRFKMFQQVFNQKWKILNQRTKTSSHNNNRAAGKNCTIFNQRSYSYFQSFSLFDCPIYI
jgi:hypothetical protein